MNRLRSLMAAALLVAVLPGVSRGQAASNIIASADVDNTLLTVSNPNNLQFGTVVPGTPTTVDPKTSANAAFFVIQGARNAEVSITMTLPATLSTGTGGWTMPISFSATAGCYRRQNATQANCTYFDPNAPLVVRINNQNPPNNHINLWMGGTVSPSPTQNGGVYRGTITLTVVYTGN